jgi:tetratricopeptide (TPR) repeat protein
MKKTEDAVLIYQKVISEYKSEDEARISAYNWLAKIYEAKRKYKEAINMYEELLKIIKKKEIWGGRIYSS